MSHLAGIVRQQPGQLAAMLLDLRQRGRIGREIAVGTGNEVAALAGFGVLQAAQQQCQLILDRVTVRNRIRRLGLPNYAAIGN